MNVVTASSRSSDPERPNAASPGLRVLVTGSSGYVGGRLVPKLLADGHQVRTTRRDPHQEQAWWANRVETVTMDAHDANQVHAACEGMDVVYYLVHGMGGDDFVEKDRRAAEIMRDAVDAAGMSRVVYPNPMHGQ